MAGGREGMALGKQPSAGMGDVSTKALGKIRSPLEDLDL